MTNYAKKHPYFLGAIIISCIAICAFIAGYRIQPSGRIQKNGFLVATLPLKNTIVYVDDKKLVTTTEENQTITLPLSVRAHDVIIGREGYFPWMTQVTIEPGTSHTIQPLFITQNTTGQIITQKDAEYWNIRNRMYKEPLPSEQIPRQQDSVSIWVSNNTIYLSTTQGEVKEIITPKDTVRSLDFYKDRTDVIMFAADTGVYVIDAVEHATEKVVNFFPVYKGSKPIFEKSMNSSVYVLDGENLMMVVI